VLLGEGLCESPIVAPIVVLVPPLLTPLPLPPAHPATQLLMAVAGPHRLWPLVLPLLLLATLSISPLAAALEVHGGWAALPVPASTTPTDLWVYTSRGDPSKDRLIYYYFPRGQSAIATEWNVTSMSASDGFDVLVAYLLTTQQVGSEGRQARRARHPPWASHFPSSHTALTESQCPYCTHCRELQAYDSLAAGAGAWLAAS
jgi:hypothetical protein